jgi:P4 family phage/plasmid primase-like protien
MKVFAKKATALKYVKAGQLICNDNIRKYFILPDYQDFLTTITNAPKPMYYEFIPEHAAVNLFLDIEIYKNRNEKHFNEHEEILNQIKVTLTHQFETIGLLSQFIVLQSHNQDKRSYHVIIRVVDKSLMPYYFKGVKSLKNIVSALFPELVALKIIDPSVYREGLFRTYLSTKDGEDRRLIKDAQSDDFQDIETFVCYCPGLEEENIIIPEQIITVPTEKADDQDQDQDNDDEQNAIIEPSQKDLNVKDKEIIKRFVRKVYKYRSADIRDVFIDHQINCIIVALNDTFCHSIDREHKSNHQYIVIDTYSSKQKCHDPDCGDYKHEEVKIKNFPKEINEIIVKCLKVNRQEQELIARAIGECKDYITSNFDENIEEIQFDKAEMVFKGDVSEHKSLVRLNGKCSHCLLEHRITNDGYCLKCKVCNSIYPKNQLIPLDERYKNLNKFWMNYSQLINNGTVNININNYYNGEEEFSCDVQLDDDIFKNKELTKLYNQILDGHKVVLLSQLMSMIEVDFRYTNGQWYFFNGVIWKDDKESLEFRKRIVKLSNNFNRIQQFYESKHGSTSNSNIIKNIKSLVNKLHKTGFEDEVVKGAKMYYNDESFIRNLNSKKHLVPFSNGVFDLLENKYRATKKEDYVNLIVGFDYPQQVNNNEVHDFINKILPNVGVRDYVLKKMSECLNGDIPNTNFLMFIGDGANGKSQLLNLMKLAMGELGEKVEVTLLTRKRNNANEANSEKIKLMHKRFAFLSEPEDGEKINIGLLKELTGSEEIVARGLYQESVSFVMEAKLFLACNDLPEIKGEDTALWRRIRVIDFPSRFVDEPNGENEYKIDRTLPSRMREDITWRQTFIKILLEYYYKDVKEPVEVQVKTNEYRQENNDFYNWLEENVGLEVGEVLQIKDVCQLYLGKSKVHSKESTKYRKEIEKWVKEKWKGIKWEYGVVKISDGLYRGWKDLCIKF